MGYMLNPLTPNLLAAVCSFFECSHCPTCFFNYTITCVLSEYIIQNDMHLEGIKINNAHHYSHNFNFVWCPFLVWILYHLYVLSIPFPMAAWPLLARESHVNTVIPSGCFFPLKNSRLICPVLEGEIIAVQVSIGMMRQISFQESLSDFIMYYPGYQIH